jgi:hypothetical protein
VKPLKYLSVADLELAEAAVFYEGQQPGLGTAFLDTVREAERKIQDNPQRWAFYERPMRSLKIGPFPHRLIYRELSDRIQVVAVAHPSRRPGYWRDRL